MQTLMIPSNQQNIMTMKAEIEILISGIAYVAIGITLFSYIHNHCLSKRKTAVYFVFPMWCLFLGFYYMRCFLDQTFEGQYWRLFRIFETITNLFFLIFIYLINKKINTNGKV